MARRSVFWSYSIASWSGFYVMLVEILSGRLISPSFGSSIYVWGSVIFVFMLGLSIGYLLGGIWSSHSPSVRGLCAILTASAVSTFPTVLFGAWAVDEIAFYIGDPRLGSLLASACFFLLPTIFAGMISPYAIRIVVRNQESSGRDAGKLYFFSTLGSSVGTLLTSFYLVLVFDVEDLLLVAISVSLAIGGVGIVVNPSRR